MNRERTNRGAAVAPGAKECCSIPTMKNVLTITSTLLLGAALALSACGKKQPAAADPAAPAATDPAAKPADPAAPAAADPAKPAASGDAKPAGGGW